MQKRRCDPLDALNQIRKKIDAYDQELVQLFEKRMEAVLQVLSLKKEYKMPIFQKEREEQVLKKAAENIQNPLFEAEAREFFETIMRISRKLQARILFPYNIVLIGFMGAGKSAVGKELSLLLEMELIDIDAYIEKEMKMTISDLFERYGEAYFRDREEEAVERISKRKNCIISCGGGVVLREKNIANLKKSGKVIFLEAKAETIYSRIQGDTTRPLLKGNMTIAAIQEKLKQRESHYQRAADFTVSTDHKTEREIAQEIIALLCEASPAVEQNFCF